MTQPTQHQKVLIVDFGSQVTQLIARRLREAGVYCEIHPFNKAGEALKAMQPQAIILSGGPNSTTEADSPRVDRAVFDYGAPILGICYGEQLICAELGGKVESGHHAEFGRAEIVITKDSPLFAGIGALDHREPVWMSHGDRVTALPEGFHVIATSEGAPFAAIADEARKIYGVQFHPEVVHTPRGAQLLKNFTHGVAGLTGDWTMAAYRDEKIAQIREQVGDAKVICGLSGGVDSSVAAVLIHEAIGDQLTCVFVDTGLLRLNEAEQVMDTFAKHMKLKVIHVDASEEFFSALAEVEDPEQKRRIIGRLFVDVFQRESGKLPKAKWLAQGTIYPDVIESAGAKTKKAHTIKSHHNVGGLPDTLHLKLLEPLRELFKDE
ncbi:MAG: glutamine-hydrolyzing GMP synthase, partial [Proteobacteria bacterium]|nr:glutamine-hydrolyzing GMP synthase [Pseudomonadota bacterium]